MGTFILKPQEQMIAGLPIGRINALENKVATLGPKGPAGAIQYNDGGSANATLDSNGKITHRTANDSFAIEVLDSAGSLSKVGIGNGMTDSGFITVYDEAGDVGASIEGGDAYFAGYLGVGTTTGPGAEGSSFRIAGDNGVVGGGQAIFTGASNPDMQLIFGYNTTDDYGQIQAVHQGVATTPLLLNPAGGAVGIGPGASTVGSTYGIPVTMLTSSTFSGTYGTESIVFFGGYNGTGYETYPLGMAFAVWPDLSEVSLGPTQIGFSVNNLSISPEGGNVSIGKTAPVAKFEVQNSGYGIAHTIYSTDGNKIFEILDDGVLSYGGDAVSGAFDPSWKMQANKTLLGAFFGNSDDYGRVIFGLGMNGSTSAASVDFRTHGSGYSEYLMGNDVTNSAVLLCNGGNNFYMGNFTYADLVFGTNNEEVGRFKADGEFFVGKEANGTYIKQFNASSLTAPEIDFFTGGSRQMVFGYDPAVSRGIFYADFSGQGVFFRTGGIGIGAIGSDVLADQVLQVPVGNTGVFIDPSFAGTYDGTSALQVVGTSKLPTIISATRLNIPNGTSVAAANAGDLALDTTDNQLLAGGGTPLVLALPKKAMSGAYSNPTAADDINLWQVPYGMTVTKVWGTVTGATSASFNLQKHSSSTLNTTGTNMLTSTLVATTTGASTTSFSSASLSAGDFVNVVTSAISGAPTRLTVMVEYTITRT